ncbi:hypothetical protein QVD17_11447 [Tagetes erecta]|uniref:Uncharacterized protein n=1 Tax=Tagetes erecta TaxID=13708 RepID=A0AAD8P260_TARER|nr:hypothetical protein QVD17_11447 [Tagetes erecta]
MISGKQNNKQEEDEVTVTGSYKEKLTKRVERDGVTENVCGPHLQTSVEEEVDQTYAICKEKTVFFLCRKLSAVCESHLQTSTKEEVHQISVVYKNKAVLFFNSRQTPIAARTTKTYHRNIRLYISFIVNR